MIPAKLAIVGDVQAGKIGHDEIAVYDLAKPREYRSIPDIDHDSTTFALEVKGESMVEEHIFPGDLIIVRRFEDGSMPQNGDLIVALYCPYSLETEETEDVSPDELDGPTVKYFYNEDGGKSWRLSIRRLSKDERDKKKYIRARIVKPIGRVVGVYREFK